MVHNEDVREHERVERRGGLLAELRASGRRFPAASRGPRDKSFSKRFRHISFATGPVSETVLTEDKSAKPNDTPNRLISGLWNSIKGSTEFGTL